METQQQFEMKVLMAVGLLKIQLLADYLDVTSQDILRNAWENGASPAEVVKDATEFYKTMVH